MAGTSSQAGNANSSKVPGLISGSGVRECPLYYIVGNLDAEKVVGNSGQH